MRWFMERVNRVTPSGVEEGWLLFGRYELMFRPRSAVGEPE
jgi:hypothetical protein